MTGPQTIALKFSSDLLTVRKTLGQVRSQASSMQLDPDDQGNIEIVLAEILNNISEHACAGRTDGVIELSLQKSGQLMLIETRDNGREMPQGRLPSGQALDTSVATEQLPEGGFGWFLIFEMSKSVRYWRDADHNHLAVSLPLVG